MLEDRRILPLKKRKRSEFSYLIFPWVEQASHDWAAARAPRRVLVPGPPRARITAPVGVILCDFSCLIVREKEGIESPKGLLLH